MFYLPGVPHSLTFYTIYNGGPTVCSANNTLTIVNPSPGSASNPAGNDSATLAQVIPNPACAGLPVLNITKTAKGCTPDPASPDWLCKWDIKLKNVGGAQQPAGNLDAGRLRVGFGNQARRRVTVDFRELVAIDRHIVSAGGRRAPATERPQQGEDRRGGHQRENEPERHAQG